MSKQVSIVEVGPRDGLQNVKELLSLDQKKNFIQYLLDHGFQNIEAGAFVRPDKVPPMADSAEIARYFNSAKKNLWYLAPNLKGLQVALSLGVSQLAFFTSGSDKFNQKNIGMSVKESIQNIQDCLSYLKNSGYTFVKNWNRKPASNNQIKLRLYVSTVIACPFEGKITPTKTLKIIEELMPFGFSQVSLGDTIGVGVPNDWKKLLKAINRSDRTLIKNNALAMHCHDTYGTALSCIAEGLNTGFRTFDSSIGGLGGCPYAPGATGNVATEDVLYFLEKQGMKTGIHLSSLLDAFDTSRTGNLCNVSKVGAALRGRPRATT